MASGDPLRFARAAGFVALALAASISASAIASTSAEGWSLTLALYAPTGQDSAELGANINATGEYDPGQDRPEPPAPPGQGWVQLFAREEAARPELEKLDRSLVAPAASIQWNLTAARGGGVQGATLSWDLDAPPDLVVEIVVGENFTDIREPGELVLNLTAGPLDFVVQAYALVGNVPSPPRSLVALPGDAPGEVRLEWDPPTEDGGIPLRGYHVYEDRGHARELLATLGRTTHYLDQGREVGDLIVYTVDAFNALGASEPSDPAVGVGTARERTLVPQSDETERTEIVSLGASTAGVADLMPMLRVEGAANTSDPRTYDLRVSTLGSARTVSVFTAGLGAPFALDARGLADAMRTDAALGTSYSPKHAEVVAEATIGGPLRLDEAFAFGAEHVDI